MSVEGKLLYEILAHPRTEQLYARYAYTHRKADGSAPTRIDYVKSILDQAYKEFYVALQKSQEKQDFQDLVEFGVKWLGKYELVDTVQTQKT